MTLPPLETLGDWLGFALSLFWIGAAVCAFVVAALHDPERSPDWRDGPL